MLEVWRAIPGFDHYQVSNMGRIKSLSRKAKCGPAPGFRITPETVIKPFIAKNTGYAQVMIGRKKYLVHRLVALAWCDGYFEGACVDHVNGTRDDNRAENLNWVTASENSRRSFQSGRVVPSKGKFSSEHPTSKSVISTCLKTAKETLWPSAMDAVRAGFDSSSISRCCSGRYKSHKGFQWRYADSVPMERRRAAEHGVRWSEYRRADA